MQITEVHLCQYAGVDFWPEADRLEHAAGVSSPRHSTQLLFEHVSS
jgi:hypothetical protein